MTIFWFLVAATASLGIMLCKGPGLAAAGAFVTLFVAPAAWIWRPQEGRNLDGTFKRGNEIGKKPPQKH